MVSRVVVASIDVAHVRKLYARMTTRIRPVLIVWLLAACTALMMTGNTMPYPVIAPWLIARNIGMGALGWMSFAFSLGNLIASPLAGSLVDRWGRRPVLLIGLISIVCVNVATVYVTTFETFVVLRFVLGFFNAGIMPAALAATADIAPEEHRAQWIGYVTSGVSIGLIIGPTIGGGLYDAYGFAMPFLVSAGLALIPVILTMTVVPETRPVIAANITRRLDDGFMDVIRNPPRPLGILAVLLLIDFMLEFNWIASEPAMISQLYTQHNYTASMFGIVVGIFGATTVLSQMLIGGISDRVGRFRAIALGLSINCAWYLGVSMMPQYTSLMIASGIAGIGAGVLTPALGAAYVDITDVAHRGRVNALRNMALAISGMCGPVVAALLTDRIPAWYFFNGATTLMALGIVCALSVYWWYERHKPTA